MRKPYSADAHNNLGAMWMRLGKLNEAEDEFKTALNILPEFPEAHAQLGAALMKQGQPEAARAHYAEAVRLKNPISFLRSSAVGFAALPRAELWMTRLPSF